MRTSSHISLITFLLIVILSAPSVAPAASSGRDPFGSAEAVVEELYQLVTMDPGTTPDWDRVRKLFIDNAIIVIRTARTETSVFDVEGFVADFIAFIERANINQTGFAETIIRKKTMVFGDIAHVLVLYEAMIPGSERKPQRGVDSFQLIRKDNRWWIVSVVNEIPTPDRPVPAALRD
ncbi:MAG: hypothetical protein GTO51_09685 [Candidatus Latescibacteria bacterium]|nr:hypothetical protein [Candidatus Latescibacterota bacterium]NIM22200.1 hypothetical protein [Candidatus Latescibacterota bacterium]NIM66239.1 hypothetical protein [Candidatus Latescibacterota bacterium]NIO02315.1 hypothetical protein [Candidatus Latescibacterota bacterium]NIO29846.1 hypothetical protein [Candidatus Latescibacterota bacterium]